MNFFNNLLQNKLLLAILAVLAAISTFLVSTYRSEKAEQGRQEAEFKAFGGGTVPSIRGEIDKMEKERQEAERRVEEAQKKTK